MAGEAHVHTSGLGSGHPKRGRGLSGKGPHCFIGNEVALLNTKNRSENPTVKAVKLGGEGSSERPGLRAVQQHRQDCSIVYAQIPQFADSTMACGVIASQCVLIPCFNAFPDIFAVMNFSILALSAVF